MNRSDPTAADLHERRRRRGYQFSVFGLMVVSTTVSLVLAVYFGIGRAAGMSNAEVVQFGFTRLGYGLPTVVVWTIGFIMAIRRRHGEKSRATLLMVTFGILIAISLFIGVAQMVIIFQMMQGGLGGSSVYLTATGILSAVVNTTGWIAILVALFWTSDSVDTEAEQPTSYDSIDASN